MGASSAHFVRTTTARSLVQAERERLATQYKEEKERLDNELASALS